MSVELTEAAVHQPVLAEEIAQLLMTRRDGVYLDGTVGAGGHTAVLLKHLDDGGRVVGIDRDQAALAVAEKVLSSFGSRAVLVHGSYDNLKPALDRVGACEVDGILLDLGVSSLQIDQGERGFSFSKEGPLDMRMDPQERGTAEEFVNTASEKRMETVLRELGEERHAGRVVRAIVDARRKKRIHTTLELADIVSRAIPRKTHGYDRRKIHPATRTFQAIRIAVNGEIERLNRFLIEAPSYLRSGGRLAVLSYHSLEDRPVKRAFLDWESRGVLKRLTKKPIVPDETEIRGNPRSRSAKLRVAEKI